MKILMINKFLHPNGGSETYMFKLGACLQQMGHEVEYFGMEHEKRCVGNRVNAYTSNMDFHGGSLLSKLAYPLKTIYSVEARKKIRMVLDDFQPNVCHINNFNYQLTPSILLEIKKWSKEADKLCKIVYTAHDGQLVCPNHLFRNPNTRENCENCIGGKYYNCTKGKCIHGSTAKSIIGTLEAYLWHVTKVYKHIDKIICCSQFMKEKLDTDAVLRDKTIALHNFVDRIERKTVEKKEYILYFGRFSEEKGIETLLEACKQLPHIPFVFAGSGLLENEVNKIQNIKNVGFQTGEGLENLIREARFSICPSVCYENCPFSVMESQMYGTPVIGTRIGGIPELIEDGKTGRLFEAQDKESLKSIILELWNNTELLSEYIERCIALECDNVKTYTEKIVKLYGE